jgi:hypothetical protein
MGLSALLTLVRLIIQTVRIHRLQERFEADAKRAVREMLRLERVIGSLKKEITNLEEMRGSLPKMISSEKLNKLDLIMED